MKLRAALLICTALIVPTPGFAAPVVGFFAGLFGVGGGFGAFFFSGFAGAAYAAGAFLGGSVLGSILLNVGLNYLLMQKPRAPSIADAKVNVRLPDAPRWQMAGTVAVGGQIGTFGEYDEDGNFWYIVAHGDAELCGDPAYFLDGIPVTLSDGTDGHTAGDVITDDFCTTPKGKRYEGTGDKLPIFRLYTVTPSVGNVYGALPAAFTTAFPALPADFYLAGVCFTVVRCQAVKMKRYGNAYRWRGGYGLGEPSLSMVGNFNRMYDPREAGHDIDDPDTWTASDGNPAIVWAWWRTARFGRNRPMAEINWTEVEAAADLCDATVLDLTATAIPRYRCGVAFPDNMPRHECEAQILLTADAFVAYDDEGKAYPKVGVYEAPTLEFTAARDILGAQTQIVDDGEAALDGVIVNYISPDHNYIKMPSAPWVNTTYYDGVSEPNYQTIDILGCQNHNQAVRLAKAIGLRSASTKRAGLQVTVKGILAAGVRTISLDYDENFQGDFEIVTPVEQDPSGLGCSFAVVPMQTDRYDLNEGEEGTPPAPTPDLEIDDSVEEAVDVAITAVTVRTATGVGVRLEATFDAPAREDREFVFRYAVAGETVYRYFETDMDELLAYSAIVDAGVEYDVSWQTVTTGGRATDWSSVTTVTATPDGAADALVSVSATALQGAAQFTGTAPDWANYRGIRLYRAATGAGFGAAVIIDDLTEGLPGEAFDVTYGTVSTANLSTNGTFAADTDWTKGTGWTIGSGVATHAAGVGGRIYQAVTMTGGDDYRVSFTIACTDGEFTPELNGASLVSGTARTASGTYAETLTAPTTPTQLRFLGDYDFDGTLDDVVIYPESDTHLPVGAGDYYLVPVSNTYEEGTPSGPFALTIR